MYKVLIVDDERIIRKGIAVTIEWEKLGFLFSGSAQNGIEAVDMINQNPPNIIITDIKMPGMDGLELIAKVKLTHPEIIFIVLSGYGEFELANEVMKYGVRHYLLKPCNECKIIEVLKDVRNELLQYEQKEAYARKNKQNLEKVLPLVKEQFLRDFIMNKAYTKDERDYYFTLLNIEKSKVRLILFQLEGEFGFEEILSLGNIIEKVVDTRLIYFNTIIKNQVLIVMKDLTDEEIVQHISEVKKSFCFYNDKEVTVSYSEAAYFKNMPLMFKDVQECLSYSFYLGEGSIIAKKDIEFDTGKRLNNNFLFDFEKIAVAVKVGNINEANEEICSFFFELKLAKYGMSITKTYCMELFLAVVRQCKPEEFERNISKMIALQGMDCFEKIQTFVKESLGSLAKSNYDGIIRRHSKLVGTIIKYLQDHLDNEDLSLKGIANDVIYMNVGYLSKLFNRETGEKFPHYLTRLRMEKAKELITSYEDDKIYELAQKVGLGDNPQYFSQLFKKYTGFSPTDYKRSSYK